MVSRSTTLTAEYAFLPLSLHVPKADSCILAYSFRSVDACKLYRSSYAARHWTATWVRWKQGRRFSDKHARSHP